MFLVFFIACTQPTPTDTSTTHQNVDCETQVFGNGLTLVDLPPLNIITVSAIDTEGTLLYDETLTSDSCGTATPFVDVSSADFGSTFDDWDHGVYALVISDESFYIFAGVLNEPEMQPLPVTTQWEFDDNLNDWVAIRDPDLGVMIGNAMWP